MTFKPPPALISRLVSAIVDFSISPKVWETVEVFNSNKKIPNNIQA